MKVEKLWFENGRIYVTNDKGETLYQSLKFYPRLLTASDEQRQEYEFEPFGIHWDEIDEDVSYESFYYEDTKEPKRLRLNENNSYCTPFTKSGNR